MPPLRSDRKHSFVSKRWLPTCTISCLSRLDVWCPCARALLSSRCCVYYLGSPSYDLEGRRLAMRSTCCRLVGLELYVDIHFVTFQTAYRFSVAVCEIVFRCHPTLMPPDVSAEMDMQLLMWLFSYAQASHAQPYRPPLVGVFDSRSVSTPVNTSCARRTGSSQQSPCVKSPCACCSTLHLQSCCSHDRAEGRHWENFSTVTGHELFCTLQEKTHGASRRGCTWHENLSYGRPLRRWHGL